MMTMKIGARRAATKPTASRLSFYVKMGFSCQNREDILCLLPMVHDVLAPWFNTPVKFNSITCSFGILLVRAVDVVVASIVHA